MITLDFTQPEALQIDLVGGKTLGLARMTQNGMSVAPGYVVCTDAHRAFLEQSGINARIGQILDAHDLHDGDALIEVAERVAAEFAAAAVPDDIAAEIIRRYEELSERLGRDPLSVAVRSSATAEDTADSSFAGEYETYVGVSDAHGVVEHVKLCWASAFTPHAIAYAIDRGMSPLAVSMAVVVQKTVKARAAGVMFTLSPTSGDRSRIVIEASWGIGLSVVGGEVSPDRFAVDKVKLGLIDKKLGDKRIEYIDGHTSTPVEEERLGVFCLSDDEAVAVARLGKALERLNGTPQDIEFAVDSELPEGDDIVLLQCRPETVWSAKQASATPTGSIPLMDRISSSVFGVATGSIPTTGAKPTLPKGHTHA
jgi:pyruvate, water dikinase